MFSEPFSSRRHHSCNASAVPYACTASAKSWKSDASLYSNISDILHRIENISYNALIHRSFDFFYFEFSLYNLYLQLIWQFDSRSTPDVVVYTCMSLPILAV